MLKVREKYKAGGSRRQRRGARRKGGQASPAPAGRRVAPQAGRLMAGAAEHLEAGRFAEAERIYRQVLFADPDFAPAHFGLGAAASRQEKHFSAYDHYKKALALDPENASCWSAFGKCLANMGQNQAAVIAYENAVSRKPRDPKLLVLAGWARYRNDEFTEALALYDRALAIKPRFPAALLGKAQQYLALGDSAAACGCYEAVLEMQSDCAEALFRLTGLYSRDELRPMIERAEKALARDREAQGAIRLHFTIAKGYQRLGENDEAFSWFASGNAEMRKKTGFDREKVRESIDATIEAFRPEVFETLAGAASETRLPVFIVGMPRSGSTLVEQIISSHPEVSDAGEFPKMTGTALLLSSLRGGQLSYPRDIARFDAAPLAALGADYLDALSLGRPEDSKRITDKLLSNFLHVGLIHILFPNATIIHCRRDPMAVGLSCFTQMFSAVHHLAYTNDLSDLGFYYRQYARLMAHWRDVLPQGRMFEVDYEEMVANQEAMSRGLIEHIGLPWDDACLEFYKLERSVRTASIGQVRKPVYKSSVEGWRKFERHLAPLREAIEAAD